MTRKNKSNQLSREYLFRAFVSLMQTERYSDINITAITAKAGVSRMAYYRNYSAKEDILTGYIDEVCAAIEHPLNDYLPIPKNAAEYMVLLFKRLSSDAFAYDYNLGLALSSAGLGDLFLESLTGNLSAFLTKTGAEAVSDAPLVAGAFYGMFIQWSRDGQQGCVTDLCDALSAFLTH